MGRRYLRFICGSLCAAIAAALLAVVPGAAFAACLSPAGSGGDVWFNKDHAVMQYCNGTNWISMLAPGATIEPSGCDAIGDVCSDGSIYAGLSPDGNAPMFTTPADAGSMSWNNGVGPDIETTLPNCTDDTPGTDPSCRTGASNTDILKGLADAGAPYVAASYCADLTAHGHSDWYLPAVDELNVLYLNNAAIGGFDTSGNWYWASSEYTDNLARIQRFNDGDQDVGGKAIEYLARCVRKGDPCARATPVPGAICANGSVYLGQQSGNKIYATDAAGESSQSWNNGSTNYTITGFTSTADGSSNTAGLVALADAGAPYDAATFCDGLARHGYSDWYLPSRDELNLLWNVGDPLAGVDTSGSWYWTSTEDDSDDAWLQRFSDGLQSDVVGITKQNAVTVRCMRHAEPGICKTPAAPAGALIFNEDYRVLQWCDGTNWRAAGPVSPSGPETGCVSPAGTGGNLVFNVEYRTLQYCDGADWIAIGKPCRSCGGSPTEKVDFYTLAGVSGRFIGGISGADQLCQDQAKAVGLGGTYKAWIADSNPASAPATRFTHATVPYVRVDGTKIADDWTDLTDGTLDSVMTSETGYENLPINGVWSNVLPDGTQASGTATDHCDDWGTGGSTGRIGHRDRTDSTWTEFATITCFASDLLYCFEQ
jgi:hypothetical protein